MSELVHNELDDNISGDCAIFLQPAYEDALPFWITMYTAANIDRESSRLYFGQPGGG